MEEVRGRQRHIRIKEFGGGTVRDMVPQAEYIALSDGSISDQNYRITTTDDGFIYNPSFRKGQENPVFVLGDSFVESSFVPQGKRFCDVLTRKMSKTIPREFLNAGYSGATSLNLLDTLINKVAGYGNRPAVVFVLPSNDVLSLQFEGGYWDMSNQRYSPILPVSPVKATSVDLEENIHQLSSIMKVMAQTCNAFSMDLFFATMPYVQTDFDALPWFVSRHKTVDVYEGLKAKRRKVNQVLRDTAQRQRVELIDLEASMQTTSHFYDDVHLNETGSAAVAQLIYKQIGKLLG